MLKVGKSLIRSLSLVLFLIFGAIYLGEHNFAGSELVHDSLQGWTVSDDDLSRVRSLLLMLDVEPMGSDLKYDREFYGQRWRDVDKNGCDQRNDVLRNGSMNVVIKENTHGCVVLEADFIDPYTGELILFRKEINGVDIDHVVPLARAWYQGADKWDVEKREAFANDHLNLLAVSSEVNRAKSDKGPEEWLPSYGRCGYVVLWIDVKSTYELTVTQEEKDVLEGILERCLEV